VKRKLLGRKNAAPHWLDTPEWAPATEIGPGRRIFLRAASVLEVAYDSRLHVRVDIHPDLFDLVIEGDCTLTTTAGGQSFNAARGVELGPLLDLAGKRAYEFEITEEGAFILGLREAGTLTAPPARQWESWSLAGPNGLSLVGAPGGVHRFGPPTDEELQRRLAETIAWCTTRSNLADPENGLRSAALQPRPITGYSDEPGAPDHRRRHPIREARIDALARTRRALLGKESLAAPGPDRLAGGRILLHAPDENLCDGASFLASKGFLDIDNVPPWDTWLFYSAPKSDGPFTRNDPGCVVSWVPPSLLSLADQGVYVIPEACTVWATDDGSPTALRLKALGWL
jgi:hypothetical protein